MRLHILNAGSKEKVKLSSCCPNPYVFEEWLREEEVISLPRKTMPQSREHQQRF